ncbi:helix-turn-helix domain-containing protein [Candidatus Shapirobacteria bacterium]|nr:helix-turn-helix domain-containing protein [Candidatus Shapirobacteria bacterium]
MFRVSSILKNTREDKDLNYLEISKKIKVPAKYLEALENEKINLLPQEPYCSLIVKDYANFLGLNGEEILSLFRRDFAFKRKSKVDRNNQISFTPQFTFKISVAFTIIIFLSYLIFEYVKFNQPPQLEVIWPSRDPNSSQVEIKGTTDPESSVRVNSDLVIVDANGGFNKKINLNSTETKVLVESKSINGKTTKVEKVLK